MPGKEERKLKAEREDAPSYLRAAGKSRMPALLAWVTSIGITLGALHLGGQALLQGTIKNLAAQQPKPAPKAEIYRPQPQTESTDWDKVVETKARQHATPEQQTTAARMPGTEPVLNKGYKPGEAINILQFNEPARLEAPKTQRKGVRVTVVAETKDSACWPLKEGSVERRNCKFSQGLSR